MVNPLPTILFASTVAVTCLSWFDEDRRFAVGYSDGAVALCSKDMFDFQPLEILIMHKV